MTSDRELSNNVATRLVQAFADFGSQFDGSASSMIMLSLLQVVAFAGMIVAIAVAVAKRWQGLGPSAWLLRVVTRASVPRGHGPESHHRRVRRTLGLFSASVVVVLISLPTNLWALSTDLRLFDHPWVPISTLAWFVTGTSAVVLFGWGARILLQGLARPTLRTIVRAPIFAAGVALVLGASMLVARSRL